MTLARRMKCEKPWSCEAYGFLTRQGGYCLAGVQQVQASHVDPPDFTGLAGRGDCAARR